MLAVTSVATSGIDSVSAPAVSAIEVLTGPGAAASSSTSNVTGAPDTIEFALSAPNVTADVVGCVRGPLEICNIGPFVIIVTVLTTRGPWVSTRTSPRSIDCGVNDKLPPV